MSRIINLFSIDDFKQEANYIIMPKSLGDVLNVNFPQIIHQIFWDWMTSGAKKLLYYKSNNLKYTFIDAYVSQYFFMINRYGNQSTDMYIRFNTMTFGIRR